MLFRNRFRKTLTQSTHLAFENLEQRAMLSTVSPTVSDVTVSSSSWDSDFIDYLQVSGLGTDGYSIPVGSTAQSQSLPWLDLDRISITFSEDVDIQASDLSISGVTNTEYTSDGFFYDPQTKTATWELETPLAAEERVMLDLDADGIDPVQDLDGNILDGEWTDEVSTYESGNGTAGGDFEFRFNVLEGDTYATNMVDYFDYAFTRGQQGLDTTDPGYNPVYDLDGDGLVEVSDWMAVLGHLWATLPTGTPAGVTNDAPTTKGFDLEAITDRENETRISLYAAFEDFEDTDSTLQYSIESQSNSGLYDSVSIDSASGEIVLDPASTGSGRNTITVLATDSGGLSVSSRFTFDLDYSNKAPVIYGYMSSYLGGYVWEVSGYVSDVDDIVEGLIIELTGLFNTRVAVAADGSFYYREIVLGEGDFVFASTYDPHGEESNNPFTFVSI